MDNRGVSEVVGVLLTIVLVAFLVGILAGPALNSIETDEPQTFVRVSVNETHVIIDNHGGDTLALDQAEVVVRSDNDRVTLPLISSNVTNPTDDGDATFEVGERWQETHGLSLSDGDSVTVLILTENNQRAAGWEGSVDAEA